VELREHAVTDFSTTTTRFAHGSKDLQVANVVLNNFLSVEPVSIINPLTNQFNWRLGSESVFSWHIEIINEADSFELGSLWLESVLRASVELGFNDFLHTICTCASREVTSERNLVRVKCH